MDHIRHILETIQGAPLPLVLALAFTTIVGAALLVRSRPMESSGINSTVTVLPRPLHCCPNASLPPTIREILPSYRS